jgi:hypothetical protein
LAKVEKVLSVLCPIFPDCYREQQAEAVVAVVAGSVALVAMEVAGAVLVLVRLPYFY